MTIRRPRRPRRAFVAGLALALAVALVPAAWAQTAVRYVTLFLGISGSSSGSIVWSNASNANLVTVESGTTTSSYAVRLPVDKGLAGQALTTDAGTPAQLSWSSVAHAMLSASVTDSTPSAVARGSIITGQGASPSWTQLVIGAANRVLRSDGTDVAWSQVALATDVSGTLPVGNGGLGITSGTSGGVLYFSGASTIASSGELGANLCVFGGGAGAGPFTDSDCSYSGDVLTLGSAGAGTNVFEWQKSMAGGATDDNFIRSTGTYPSTLTATTSGALFNWTTAGSSNQVVRGMEVNLLAGWTGGATSAVYYGSSTVVGNGALVNRIFEALVPTSGHTNVGFYTTGTATGRAYGVRTLVGSGNNPSLPMVGVQGSINPSGLSGSRAGGYFTIGNLTLADTGVTAVVIADNGTLGVDLLLARDNSATASSSAAWVGARIQDNGQYQNGNGVLTSATMTPETAGELRWTHSSYTWSNAQVVALGAGTTGDITVATLPAKTAIRNAYIVITGAAAGPTTVTVSCGDAVGGTPFINYVVASDAKAAANTVYGDAVAERGTALDVEFYNVPSYTATTLVTCHFISSGGNLNTVTGSTGRVILETALAP